MVAPFDDTCKEINLHVRHVTHMLVTWYTFFVTANLLAVGWFIAGEPIHGGAAKSMIWSVVVLFLVVNLLAIEGLRAVRRYVDRANDTLQFLLSLLPPDELSRLL
jgi:ABC-type transport system involved in cytochrome bd biosynthesis fused ATPase/permease subunit